jgi:hypothetical protein
MKLYRFNLKTMKCLYVTSLPRGAIFAFDEHIYVANHQHIICAYDTKTKKQFTISNEMNNIQFITNQYICGINYPESIFKIESITLPKKIYIIDSRKVNRIHISNNIFCIEWYEPEQQNIIASVFKIYD